MLDRATQPSRLGIVGCGDISSRYAAACGRFADLTLAACADVDLDRARQRSAQAGGQAYPSIEALLGDDDIDVVVNLTPPAAHADVTAAALTAGRHVYSEKPLATDHHRGAELVRLAASAGCRLGCAPDTFLGAGLQTCRELIDRGAIGEPLAATALCLDPGPDDWHPNPAFFYQPGAGPTFDMGPYYVTALVALLGSISSVRAGARTSATRRPKSGPAAGTLIPVRTPTHVAGTLLLESGAVVTLTFSFDVKATQQRPIEIYGSEGTLSVPDPNTFGGPVRLWRTDRWEDMPLIRPYRTEARGLGVVDMVAAIAADRPHRASAELALHTLETLDALHQAAFEGSDVPVTSTVPRPEPLAPDLIEGATLR